MARNTGLSKFDSSGMRLNFYVEDDEVKQLAKIEERLVWLSDQGFAQKIRGVLTKLAGTIIFDSIVEECVKEIYDTADSTSMMRMSEPGQGLSDFPTYPRTEALLESHRKVVIPSEGFVSVFIDPEATVTTTMGSHTYTKRVIDYARWVHNGYNLKIFGRDAHRAIPGRPWFQTGWHNCYRTLVAQLESACYTMIEEAVHQGIQDWFGKDLDITPARIVSFEAVRKARRTKRSG